MGNAHHIMALMGITQCHLLQRGKPPFSTRGYANGFTSPHAGNPFTGLVHRNAVAPLLVSQKLSMSPIVGQKYSR